MLPIVILISSRISATHNCETKIGIIGTKYKTKSQKSIQKHNMEEFQEVTSLGWADRLFQPQRSATTNNGRIFIPNSPPEAQEDDNNEFEAPNPFSNLHIISTNDNGPNNNQEKEQFITQPLKSRKRSRKILGKPGCRSRCFGCVYLGEKDTSIPSKDVQILVDMQRNSAACTDLGPLVLAMEEQYEKLRTKINAALRRGDQPLPPWPAAMILDHLENHTLDPEVQKVVVLKEVMELRYNAADMCIEKSNKTGRKRINKAGVDAYEKLVKLQFYLQRLKPEEMDYFSAGARINPSSTNQGLIATGTKKLIKYWD